MFRINIKQFRVQFGLDVKVIKRAIHRKNSYYDLLGITPRATQADIKQAFYKLSMQFHPDKTTGDDRKFREISAAYEVLRNSKLRRMYDKGYLPIGASPSTYEDIKKSPEPDPLREEFKKPRERPNNGAPPTGRSAAYDFDEWTRMHYSEAFTRSRIRVDQYQWAQYKRRKQQYNVVQKLRIFRFLTFVAVFAIMYNATFDWDNPPPPPKRE